MNFCIYKARILVHVKPLYSNAKLIAFWRNACILHDTVLGFCQATKFFKRIVHMYILIGKRHPIYIQRVINKSVQLLSEYKLALIV